MKFSLIISIVAFLSISTRYSTAKPALLGFFCPNLVNCFVDPCQVSQCPAYPKATCASNYCGGCNAVWYLDGKQIDCSKPPMPIQDEDTKCITVNCFVNPCAYAKCQKHPTAVCRANYCGGCNAWFYADQKRVECD